ncbi:MAG TPA: glycoside hydrolase family 38 C-terminal domain-containing protein, partial [Acidimicrobiales bacterium]|nr:glycoside hydrolase family 38 C-terminal domain-containing protein [Acidimicrobiales bacterium]
MHNDREQLEARIRRVLGRVEAAVVAASVPCAVSALPAGPPGAVEPFEQVRERLSELRPIAAGERWGPAWTTTWLQVSGKVPASWTGRRVELVVDLGFDSRQPGFQAEGLVYDWAGGPVKGIHPRNATIPVALVTRRSGADPADAGPPGSPDEVSCFVEAVAMPGVMGASAGDRFEPTKLGSRTTAGSDPIYRFGGAQIVLVDDEVRSLCHDIAVLAGLMVELPLDSARRHLILRGLERAVDRLDQAGVAPGAKAARAELAELLAAPAEHSAHRVTAVGHAHIDSAWLWPLSETVRKCARTFSSVCTLLDQEPDIVFGCSQAQQWDWMREHYPAVFERMVKWARTGRFLPVGGMWVESDTNVPGGESLARQLLYGKGFFLEQTGVECEEVWLPDCFGYSAALPQLIALAGSRWFLTQKLSWNDTNRFPHHSFFWEGIDGTRIFTHFPPVDTYNAELTPAELARARRRFAEHGRARTSLVPFGYGDGGGGPTPQMLERGRRQADLEGSPRVSFESPAAFFRAAEEDYPDAAVWSGDLYLELHRGTLVSQARIKRGNRRCEHLLREAELWWTTAWRAGLTDYPSEALERLWKTVLLQQFHDILPGSSIADVNDEAIDTFAAVEAELEALIGTATTALAGPGDEVVAFNAGPFPLAGVPALASGWPVPPVGRAASCMRDDTGRLVLSNGRLEVLLGEEAVIESLVDLAGGRELLAPGRRANLLQLHPDHPVRWDAWDLDGFYRHAHDDLLALDEMTIVTAGPDEAVVRIERSFGASRVTQRLRLRRGERRLRIETEVDWHEHERILKLAIPLDLHVPAVSAEIQFGHLREQIGENTSWEAARFEQRWHRFAHLAEPGEPGYGVAIANDSLYGYDVAHEQRPGGGLTTTWRCSLVRGPRFPDPRADAGIHRSVVELWPGASLFEAVRAGYGCNLPLRLVRGGGVLAPIVTLEADDATVGGAALGGAGIAALQSSLPGTGSDVARAGVAGGARGGGGGTGRE